MAQIPEAHSNRSVRVMKLVAVLCFLSVAVAIIAATNSPATGYELSIYQSTPILVWSMLLFCVAGGAWLVAYQVFTGRRGVSLGVVLAPLSLAHATVLLLPALRGYFLYASSDSLIHVGQTLDTLTTGHVASNNFYPTLHILLAQLSQLCGIPPAGIARFLPILLSLIFAILWIYLLARAILLREGQALLAFGLASGFLLNSLHVMIYPQVFAFFTLVLVVYLRLERSLRRRPASRIPIIVLLVFIAFSHPATALECIILLLAIELADFSYQRIRPRSPVEQTSPSLPVIAVIVFFAWISSFLIFGQTLRSLFWNLSNPLAGAHVETLEVALASAGTPLDIFFKMYGDSILSLALALVGVVLLAVQVLRGKGGLRNLWVVAAAWLTMILVELFIFFGVGLQTVGRLANLSLVVFFSPLLAGFALHEILRRARRAVAVAAATALLVIMWVASASSVYHSPWLLQPSWQITKYDWAGSEWFVEHKSEDLMYSALGYDLSLPSAVAGYIESTTRADLRDSPWQMRIYADQVLPAGFGYDHLSTFGEILGEPRYLVLANSFQLAIEDPSLSSRGLTVIPLYVPGFQPADFDKLGEDPSANKVYSNGELDIWQIGEWSRGN